MGSISNLHQTTLRLDIKDTLKDVIDVEYTIIKEDNKEDIKSITHNAETETCNSI